MYRIEREVVMRAVASKLTGLTVVVVAAMAFVFVPALQDSRRR